MASFSVVALMRETPSVVRRFIAHYRGLGAERVYVLFDGPLDALIADGVDPAALDAEGVTLVSCDGAFWDRELGRRPSHVQERLRDASMVGHRWNRSDWLFSCDADEYLLDRMPVGAFLDRIPADVDSVLVRPVEAVWGPEEDIDTPFGSTWFRRWCNLSALGQWRAFGPLAPLFWRGLLGHSHGKQFVRRGARFDAILAHNALRDGQRVSRQAASIDPALGVMEVAHFDAVCYARWREKFVRRLAADEKGAMDRRPWRRRAQIHLFRVAGWFGDRARKSMFRALYQLSPAKMRFLVESDRIFQADLFSGAGAAAQNAAPLGRAPSKVTSS